MPFVIFPDESLSSYKRFEVRGNDLYGVQAIKRFSHIKAAKRFADSLFESEVWDIQGQKFVYGNSNLMKTLGLHN